jgi:hypothetical protein
MISTFSALTNFARGRAPPIPIAPHARARALPALVRHGHGLNVRKSSRVALIREQEDEESASSAYICRASGIVFRFRFTP